MEISFVEHKRQSNLTKHGLDFADLNFDYFLSSIVLPAKLGRYMAIGVLVDDVIATVFVKLGSLGLSIVSMRAASRKERNAYGKFIATKTNTN